MKTKNVCITTCSKSVAKKLILLAAVNYLASCTPNQPQIEELAIREEPMQLDQLTDADRAEFEAWLNGPIATKH